MALEDNYPNIAYLITETFETVAGVKNALADGDLNPQELVAAIPDEGVRDYLRRLLDALKALPGEVEAAVSDSPWNLLDMAKDASAKAAEILRQE